ncbi:hypothetical protein HDU96_009914 [Phlyctochytrium bullatum]|nr:hypothetical protein HDU96_009914 [Phlyctochytrium bullatum]
MHSTSAPDTAGNEGSPSLRPPSGEAAPASVVDQAQFWNKQPSTEETSLSGLVSELATSVGTNFVSQPFSLETTSSPITTTFDANPSPVSEAPRNRASGATSGGPSSRDERQSHGIGSFGGSPILAVAAEPGMSSDHAPTGAQGLLDGISATYLRELELSSGLSTQNALVVGEPAANPDDDVVASVAEFAAAAGGSMTRSTKGRSGTRTPPQEEADATATTPAVPSAPSSMDISPATAATAAMAMRALETDFNTMTLSKSLGSFLGSDDVLLRTFNQRPRWPSYYEDKQHWSQRPLAAARPLNSSIKKVKSPSPPPKDTQTDPRAVLSPVHEGLASPPLPGSAGSLTTFESATAVGSPMTQWPSGVDGGAAPLETAKVSLPGMMAGPASAGLSSAGVDSPLPLGVGGAGPAAGTEDEQNVDEDFLLLPENLTLCITIYPYQAAKNDEISFTEGHIIRVVRKVHGGWWEGQLDQRVGWFPANHVMTYVPVSVSGNMPSGSGSAQFEIDDQIGPFANTVEELDQLRLKTILFNNELNDDDDDDVPLGSTLAMGGRAAAGGSMLSPGTAVSASGSKLFPAFAAAVEAASLAGDSSVVSSVFSVDGEAGLEPDDIVVAQRNRVIGELRNAEKGYLSSLLDFVNEYVNPLTNETWFPMSDRVCMFSNIQDLVELHQSFVSTLGTLTAASHKTKAIASAFINFDLIAVTPATDADVSTLRTAYECLEESFNDIESARRMIENREVVRNIMRKLDSWEGPGLEHYGDLLLEGNLKLHEMGRARERQFYLLEKILVILRSDRSLKNSAPRFRLVERILMSRMVVKSLALLNDPEESPLSFQMVYLTDDSKEKKITITAFNPDQRRLWMTLIEQQLDKNKRDTFPSLPRELQDEILSIHMGQLGHNEGEEGVQSPSGKGSKAPLKWFSRLGSRLKRKLNKEGGHTADFGEKDLAQAEVSGGGGNNIFGKGFRRRTQQLRLDDSVITKEPSLRTTSMRTMLTEAEGTAAIAGVPLPPQAVAMQITPSMGPGLVGPPGPLPFINTPPTLPAPHPILPPVAGLTAPAAIELSAAGYVTSSSMHPPAIHYPPATEVVLPHPVPVMTDITPIIENPLPPPPPPSADPSDAGRASIQYLSAAAAVAAGGYGAMRRGSNSTAQSSRSSGASKAALEVAATVPAMPSPPVNAAAPPGSSASPPKGSTTPKAERRRRSSASGSPSDRERPVSKQSSAPSTPPSTRRKRMSMQFLNTAVGAAQPGSAAPGTPRSRRGSAAGVVATAPPASAPIVPAAEQPNKGPSGEGFGVPSTITLAPLELKLDQSDFSVLTDLEFSFDASKQAEAEADAGQPGGSAAGDRAQQESELGRSSSKKSLLSERIRLVKSRSMPSLSALHETEAAASDGHDGGAGQSSNLAALRAQGFIPAISLTKELPPPPDMELSITQVPGMYGQSDSRDAGLASDPRKPFIHDNQWTPSGQFLQWQYNQSAMGTREWSMTESRTDEADSEDDDQADETSSRAAHQRDPAGDEDAGMSGDDEESAAESRDGRFGRRRTARKRPSASTIVDAVSDAVKNLFKSGQGPAAGSGAGNSAGQGWSSASSRRAAVTDESDVDTRVARRRPTRDTGSRAHSEAEMPAVGRTSTAGGRRYASREGSIGKIGGMVGAASGGASSSRSNTAASSSAVSPSTPGTSEKAPLRKSSMSDIRGFFKPRRSRNSSQSNHPSLQPLTGQAALPSSPGGLMSPTTSSHGHYDPSDYAFSGSESGAPSSFRAVSRSSFGAVSGGEELASPRISPFPAAVGGLVGSGPRLIGGQGNAGVDGSAASQGIGVIGKLRMSTDRDGSFSPNVGPSNRRANVHSGAGSGGSGDAPAGSLSSKSPQESSGGWSAMEGQQHLLQGHPGPEISDHATSPANESASLRNVPMRAFPIPDMVAHEDLAAASAKYPAHFTVHQVRAPSPMVSDLRNSVSSGPRPPPSVSPTYGPGGMVGYPVELRDRLQGMSLSPPPPLPSDVPDPEQRVWFHEMTARYEEMSTEIATLKARVFELEAQVQPLRETPQPRILDTPQPRDIDTPQPGH